jgi:hypothetical protein
VWLGAALGVPVTDDFQASSSPAPPYSGEVKRSFDFPFVGEITVEAPVQDRLLSEVARVLRPGGVFAGTDSLYSRSFRLLHLFDTMVVIDPATFAARLRTAGFDDINVDVMKPYAFRFRARKPNPVAV